MKNVETIEIKKIRTDAGTQSRVEISEELVQEYFETIEDEGDLPPVVVFFDGISYYLADGFHRVMAYQRATREYVEAQVKGGTLRDAIKYSLSANAEHGLRRTHEDKRKAVLIALDDLEWSELPAREIARMCKVSHTFVNKIIKERTQPPKDKPTKLKNVVEAPLETPEVLGETPSPLETFPHDMVQEVVAENEQLKDRLAVAAMDATDEEKELAKETIDELRAIVKNLNVELEAVKKSRDQYQRECTELRKQCKMYQNQLKKLA
jgi:ParB-like chromosome segregation protein Spo0J